MKKLIFGALALVVIVGLALFGLTRCDGPAIKAVSTVATTTAATTTPTATVTATPTASTCPYGPAVWVPSASYRLIADGLPRDNAQTTKEAALAAAKTNPVFVAGFAMERKLEGGAYIDSATLTAEGCWTSQGRDLSLKVQGLIEAAQASVGEAPADGTNSGGHDGTFVVAEKAGISGDLTALVLTHQDGTKTTILVRCGNIVFPRGSPIPPAPVGPTDQVISDECPDDQYPAEPGTQPKGHLCSKGGTTGSLGSGVHDPQGGSPDPVRNPVTTVETTRPVVTARTTASASPTSATTATTSASTPTESTRTTPPPPPPPTSAPQPSVNLCPTPDPANPNCG